MNVNSEFRPKIDFLSIPGARIIDGRDTDLSSHKINEQMVEPITGVPVKNFFMTPTTITIPKIAINDLVNLVETFLFSKNNFKNKLKSNKKSDFVYEAEYFPIEGIEISPKERSHRMKTAIMYEAINKASRMFPHIYDDDDDDLIEFVNFPTEKISLYNWFKMEISIMYDNKDDNYILEINRIRGEAFSFYEFYNEFQTFINNLNILWLIRKNYINLLEGTNNDNVDPNKKHINRFLFNEMICREICSFIGYQPNVKV